MRSGAAGPSKQERAAAQDADHAIEGKLDATEAKIDANAEALAKVRSQLDLGGDPPPSLSAMAEDLKAASGGTRSQAFYLARDQRRSNWTKDESDKEKRLVGLTIPVFEALVMADQAERFHRNHAELAYSLKDQRKLHRDPEDVRSDLERARRELGNAIKLRGAGGAADFPMYEYNRAYLNVVLDPAGDEGPSAPDLARKIRADLDVVAATDYGAAVLKSPKETGQQKHDRGRSWIACVIAGWEARNEEPASS